MLYTIINIKKRTLKVFKLLMDVYNTLLLLGTLQGSIIGIYFLCKHQKISATFRLLCFFMLVLSLALLEVWMTAVGLFSMATNATFGIPFHLLTLPAFYVYIKYYIEITSIKKIHYALLLAPFTVSILLKIWYQCMHALDTSLFSLSSLRYYLLLVHKIFIVLSTGYLIELIINLIQYQKKSSHVSLEIRRKIKWIFYFFSMLITVLVLWCLITFIFTKTYQLRYIALFATTFVIYWIGFTGIHELKTTTQKEASSEITTQDAVPLKKNATAIPIKKENFEKIVIGLQKLEAQHYFLQSDCTVTSIAKKLKTNHTYVSKVIKMHYQKNFHQYINDLRIEYVIQRLMSDAKLRKYSVASISQELGYKTPDTFTKYFRKHTGILPSSYIKKLEE